MALANQRMAVQELADRAPTLAGGALAQDVPQRRIAVLKGCQFLGGLRGSLRVVEGQAIGLAALVQADCPARPIQLDGINARHGSR